MPRPSDSSVSNIGTLQATDSIPIDRVGVNSAEKTTPNDLNNYIIAPHIMASHLAQTQPPIATVFNSLCWQKDTSGNIYVAGNTSYYVTSGVITSAGVQVWKLTMATGVWSQVGTGTIYAPLTSSAIYPASLAIASNGTIGLSFNASNLIGVMNNYFVLFDGTSWGAVEQVSIDGYATGSSNNSITVDSTGVFHCVYSQPDATSTYGNFFYTKRVAGVWQTRTLIAGPGLRSLSSNYPWITIWNQALQYPAIMFINNSSAAVSYLAVSYFNGTTWTTVNSTYTPISLNDFAYNSTTSTLYISYTANIYVYQIGVGWSSNINTNNVNNTQILTDSAGNLYTLPVNRITYATSVTGIVSRFLGLSNWTPGQFIYRSQSTGLIIILFGNNNPIESTPHALVITAGGQLYIVPITG